jgi:hypothetical protein
MVPNLATYDGASRAVIISVVKPNLTPAPEGLSPYRPLRLPRSPKNSEIMKRIIKIINRTLAISTEITAMPVKPKSAASIAITRNVTAMPSILPSHVS